MKIVDVESCEPIVGAQAEIWSCDAQGNYSGYPDVDPNVALRPGRGQIGPSRRPPSAGGREPGAGGRAPTGPQRFLRGAQSADDRGEVEFLTIYPGWYAPRAVHVHLKIHLRTAELLTTQLYFPDDLTDAIHKAGAYASRHPTPYRNAGDRVKKWGLDGNDPVGVYPEMAMDGKLHLGSITIGVRRA